MDMLDSHPVQQLGAFRLLRLIGSGGMGEVWLAEDTRLLRLVVSRSAAEARARLLHEAQIAAQLNRPAVGESVAGVSQRTRHQLIANAG